MRHTNAFTLIELLVVVTIIVVLLAMLVPAMNKAIYQAERVRCGANQNQIGLGLQQYAMEFGRKMPASLDGVGRFGDEDVYPYYQTYLGVLIDRLRARQVFTCPTAESAEESYPGYGPTPYSDTNYMGNAVVFGRPLSRLRNAGGTAVIQEDRWRWHVLWMRPVLGSDSYYYYWHWTKGFTIPEEYSTPHEEGGMLLFADGHVEYRLGADLRAADFGLTGGDGVTGNAGDTQDDPDNRNYRAGS